MQIRKATTSDIKLLAELMMQFNAEESIINSPSQVSAAISSAFLHPELVSSYIAHSAGTTIGYINVTYTYSFEFMGIEVAIDEIFILPQHRRSGAASRLISQIESEAKKLGAVVISGDIADNKPWLKSFYVRNGFSMAAYRPYYKAL
ncbi:GNAT family N-acetyltransferase [Pokkaliibacter sp. MBI-7]|uniref:GNAT family N-acetyltransferase n=1 Tax=Pokkaliibacter sp. MBI-7 TaxID=3040600 RepID=UPI002449DB70|nr:GNAT family N-acetyltransferase [Pokkaliibacter sp. MBI-7]MDH2434470.1 GNAT family N-acetyltransferase [Pokkaliibacter sp. MBI-7]